MRSSTLGVSLASVRPALQGTRPAPPSYVNHTLEYADQKAEDRCSVLVLQGSILITGVIILYNIIYLAFV